MPRWLRSGQAWLPTRLLNAYRLRRLGEALPHDGRQVLVDHHPAPAPPRVLARHAEDHLERLAVAVRTFQRPQASHPGGRCAGSEVAALAPLASRDGREGIVKRA